MNIYDYIFKKFVFPKIKKDAEKDKMATIKELEEFAKTPLSEEEIRCYEQNIRDASIIKYVKKILKIITNKEFTYKGLLKSLKDRGGALGANAAAALDYLEAGKSPDIFNLLNKKEVHCSYYDSLFLAASRDGFIKYDDPSWLLRLMENSHVVITWQVYDELSFKKKMIRSKKYRLLIPHLIKTIREAYPMPGAEIIDVRMYAIDILGEIANQEDIEVIELLQQFPKTQFYKTKSDMRKYDFLIKGSARKALEKILARSARKTGVHK